jgi:hypothetical protein
MLAIGLGARDISDIIGKGRKGKTRAGEHHNQRHPDKGRRGIPVPQ